MSTRDRSRYSILAPEGLSDLEVQPRSRIILETGPDGLPSLVEVRETVWDFDALLKAIDDGTVQPEHAEQLQDLREVLAQLARHQHNCEDACEGLPEETWAHALQAATQDYHPDGRGGCDCPVCLAARERGLALVR